MRHGAKTFVYLALIAFGIIASLLMAADVQAQGDAPATSPQAPAVTVSGQVRLGGVGEPGVIVELRSGVTVVASATTNGAGQYSLNAPAGILTLSARKGVYAFEPAFRRIIVLVGGGPITQDFTMIRPPIVIQGGYTPLSPPQSGCPQRRLDGSTYDPGVCGEDGFAELLADLRGAGWNVRTVMMNSSLLRTPALATQTSALRRAINDAKAATGASKVILFAHSTGGPVARRYIESTLYAGDVSHLFTFGSQHMGNPIEDIADVWFNQIMPDYLRENTIVPEPLIGAMVAVIDFVIQDKVNFLCSTRLFQFTIPFVGTYNVPGPNQAVLCETSISGMANFNLSFRPRTGVSYHLVHGQLVRSADMNALGQAMTAAIPGRDDTLIQTNSTTGFLIGGPHDRLLTRDPHMTETSNGQRWYLNTNGAFDSAYVVCIRPMFILRTISAPNCGTASTARSGEGSMDVVAVAPDAASALLAELGIAANEPTEQKTRLRTALLPDTHTVVTHTVQVIETGAATFLTNWVTGTLSFTMTDANGAVITPGTATGDILFVSDATHASYVFSATQPGPHTLYLQATAAPTTGVAVNYYAALESAYLLTATRSRNWLPPAETITVTALFTGPTAIENPQVIAYVRGSNGVSATAPLDDLGNGNYRHVYIAPGAPGYIEMEIVATGSVDGVEIERNDNVAFTVYPDSFRPNGVYTETVDPWGLTLQVGINVTPDVSGDFRVTGVLVAGDGQEVASATSAATAPAARAGAALLTVPLFFDGQELYAAGEDGPFVVRRLLVIDEREHALVSADEVDVFTTSAIDVDLFANTLFLPLVTR